MKAMPARLTPAGTLAWLLAGPARQRQGGTPRREPRDLETGAASAWCKAWCLATLASAPRGVTGITLPPAHVGRWTGSRQAVARPSRLRLPRNNNPLLPPGPTASPHCLQTNRHKVAKGQTRRQDQCLRACCGRGSGSGVGGGGRKATRIAHREKRSAEGEHIVPHQHQHPNHTFLHEKQMSVLLR